MPLFTIRHSCGLSPEREVLIAEAITKIHAEKFGTPYNFVNILFEDISMQAYFVGGKRALKANIITAEFRANGESGTRSAQVYQELLQEITLQWNEIMGGEDHQKPETKLKVLAVMPTLHTVIENGFVLPPVGQEQQWMKDNLHDFMTISDTGDKEFTALIEEIRLRDIFKDVATGLPSGAAERERQDELQRLRDGKGIDKNHSVHHI